MDGWMDEWMNEWTNEPINQSINQTINQSIKLLQFLVELFTLNFTPSDRLSRHPSYCVDWDPPHLSPVYSVLYITPTCTSSMQEFIMQGMHQKLQKSCFRYKKNTWYVESNYILQPPKYLIIIVNRSRYKNNNVTEDRCSIPMDITIQSAGYHRSSRTVFVSGHYTTSVKSCKNILLRRQQNFRVWNDWYQKLLYCICANVWIN